MSNQFEVGKTYQCTDEFIAKRAADYPDNGQFVCHRIDADGNAPNKL